MSDLVGNSCWGSYICSSKNPAETAARKPLTVVISVLLDSLIFSLSQGKLHLSRVAFRVSDQVHTNGTVQLQKIARGLKFRI